MASSPKRFSTSPLNGRWLLRTAPQTAWIVLIGLGVVSVVSAAGVERADPGQGDCAVPAWLYPKNSPTEAPKGVRADQTLHLPGSKQAFTRSQLANLNSAPDWHPESHGPLPAIVENGRPPAIFACAYCHSPTGQGRPENTQLAGLPASYISQQLKQFASGARRGAWCGSYLPSEYMVQSAKELTDAEVAIAADYFARQTPQRRVRVVETDRIPRWRVIGLVYARSPEGGEEPLGARLMEFSPDAKRHELRDDRMQYVAYVPRGSIARGRLIASQGFKGASSACKTCHGPALEGLGAVPALAGKSPTYVLRALFAFRTLRRTGENAALMQPIAAQLDLDAMIDVAAYAASLSIRSQPVRPGQ